MSAAVKSPDANVEDVRELLLQRSQVGLEKYGVTTMRTDLDLRAWLVHALEETLDKAVYLRAAIRRIDEGGLQAAVAAPAQESILWRYTGIAGLNKALTDEQYRMQPPGIRRWYEPMCAKCTSGNAPSDKQ